MITSSLSVTVQTGPQLTTSSVIMSPAAISLGQLFTLVVSVSNSGQAVAVNTAPFSVNKLGSAFVSSLTGPIPATASVSPGATVSFTYTGSDNTGGSGVITPWTLGFAASVQGYDANTGATATASAVNSNIINVSTPASLGVALSVSPSVVNLNQQVVISLTVSNSGDATALQVLPTALIQSGTGGFALVNPPSQTPFDIAKGVSHTFNWTYNSQGTGTVSFNTSAIGTDGNSGTQVSSAVAQSGIVTVLLPANLLTISNVAAPNPVGTGANISVFLQVQNTGETAAVNVSAVPSLLVTGGTANLASGPFPSLVNSLAGGGSVTFTYIYTAPVAAASISFSGFALGVDANTNLGLTSTALTSNGVVVQSAANLTANYVLNPPHKPPWAAS